MDDAFQRAAATVAAPVVAFVEAADFLVNTLATTAVDTAQGRQVHEQTLRDAYNAYDRARRALTGDDVSSV